MALKILVFTPGGQGGSEVVMYNLLRQLDQNEFQVEVILCETSYAPEDIKTQFKTHVLPSKKSRKGEIVSKLARNTVQVEIDEQFILNLDKKFTPDLWYINTSVLWRISSLAIKNHKAYLVHFHELTSVFDQMKDGALTNMVENARSNIACSKSVGDVLKTFKNARVDVFHSRIDISQINTDEASVQRIQKELELDKFKFIWLMSGASSPRKGFDLLPLLAERLPQCAFIWIGRQRDHGYNRIVQNQIEAKGLNNVFLIDHQKEDYYNFIQAADGFVLTSREDPFPLVMIEAAYLQKPIAAFNSGGVQEFVKDGMGKVVPLENHEDLIDAMRSIQEGQISIEQETLRERAEEFTFESGMSSWNEILKQAIKQ